MQLQTVTGVRLHKAAAVVPFGASLPSAPHLGWPPARHPSASRAPHPAPSQHDISQHCGSGSFTSNRLLPAAALPGDADEDQWTSGWCEREYARLAFVSEPFGPMQLYEEQGAQGAFNGVLLFQRAGDSAPPCDQSMLPVLEVYVAGDTAFNTWSLLSQRTTERPMVHDLMWNMMSRMADQHSGQWSLLHSAIVELKNNVFIGRLFFGDPATGEVKWDCDCRPSDGCYLALRAGRPFYVHHPVWDQACLPLKHSSAYQLVMASPSSVHPAPTSQDLSPPLPPTPAAASASANKSAGGMGEKSSGSGSSAPSTPYTRQVPGPPPPERTLRGAAAMMPARPLTVDDITLLRPDDPDAIKLLKRELAVAVGEEDFSSAIRIRDHPWMKLYKEIHTLRMQGQYSEAHLLDLDLRRQIEAVAELGTN